MKKPNGSRTWLAPLGYVPAQAPDSLYAEEFDALVRELVPKIRLLVPRLSDLDVLRAAARMAEYRLTDERTLLGEDFRRRG